MPTGCISDCKAFALIFSTLRIREVMDLTSGCVVTARCVQGKHTFQLAQVNVILKVGALEEKNQPVLVTQISQCPQDALT